MTPEEINTQRALIDVVRDSAGLDISMCKHIADRWSAALDDLEESQRDLSEGLKAIKTLSDQNDQLRAENAKLKNKIEEDRLQDLEDLGYIDRTPQI